MKANSKAVVKKKRSVWKESGYKSADEASEQEVERLNKLYEVEKRNYEILMRLHDNPGFQKGRFEEIFDDCIQKALEKSTDSDIKTYITSEKWNEFDDTYLVPSVKAESQDLAGFTRKPSEDFNEDNLHVGTDFGHKFTSFYSNSDDQDNEIPDDQDLNEREDDETSPQKEVHTNYDNLLEEDPGRVSESWSKREAEETNTLAHSDKNLWNHTFKFDSESLKAPEEASIKTDDLLSLNRELQIIELDFKEDKLVSEFANNQYWARPRNTGVNVDDLMKEIEGI